MRLAAHPDDPPLPTLRQTARLVYKPELYQRLLDIVPSHANALEFCQGTISEMVGEMDVYEAIDRYNRPTEDRLRPFPQRPREGTQLPRGIH